MNQGEGIGIKVVKWLFLIMFLGVCAYFAWGERFLPADSPASEYWCEEFAAEWERVEPDGTKTPVSLPCKFKASRNELITIETTLPEVLHNNTYLCFRSSKQEMLIYVDGIIRQQYSTKETRLFGNTSAVAYVFLELEPEDAGKKITVSAQTDSSYTGVLYRVYCGDRMGIWHYFFKQYGGELFIAFLILVLGTISIAGSMALRFAYGRKIELEYLGWVAFVAAIWLLANSAFRQLIFPSISVINDIAFYMVMIIPFPLILYMNEAQKGRYQKYYVFAGMAAVVDFIVCTLLHVTCIRDFADTIKYMAAVCLLAIIVIGTTLVADICKGRIREYRLVAVGILGISLAAIGQIVMYFKRSVPFSGAITALGLIFLMLISIVNAIRDLLKMESEKQQAILSSEAKAKFLANMSHEIRTPINAVLGMDAMILRECDDMVIKEYALDIQNAGQSLLSLVNDILDLSKIESGKLEIIPAEYDFSSMIHDIANMVSMKAQEKNLVMGVRVDPTLPSRLFGDEIRIRQILINLLNNAVKYTHEGSVSLSVAGTVQDNLVTLEFSVEDTGIGIKEEDISKLFAEFERIEEERNRNIEGTGLGMSITSQLLDMMGSRLKVESVYGEGSRFSFELEQQIIDAGPIGNLEERIRKQTADYSYDVMFTAPDARVLVVDDNGVNRKVFVNLLKATKMQIDMAESGGKCLEMVSEKHYDLIFLDHMMPEMDGVQTLHHMKEKADYPCKETPVIALTANAISGAREMYLSEGFDDFLSKPVIPEKLEAMVQKMLPQDLIVVEQIESPKAEKPDGTSGKDAPAQEGRAHVEDLPDIDGIDWNYAMLHLQDMDLLMDTLSDFYRAASSEADYLEDCYRKLFHGKPSSGDTGDMVCEDAMQGCQELLGSYRIKVHAMKGSAALIGAVPLSGVAKMLEYAAKKERIQLLESLTPAFLEEWRAMKELLAPLVNREGEKIDADYAMISAYLQELAVAMEDLDIDAADQTMDALMQYAYPPDIQITMEQLATAVANLDSDQSMALIEPLLDKIEALD